MILGGTAGDDLQGGADPDMILGDGFDLDITRLEALATELKNRRFKLLGVTVETLGTGADTIDGGEGFDFILGGGGVDTLFGGDDGAVILGDGLSISGDIDFTWAGWDTIGPLNFATKLSDLIDLSVTVDADSDPNNAQALAKRDVIQLSGGVNVVVGGLGNDEVRGGGSADFVFGNAGDDDIRLPQSSFSIVFGGDDRDIIHTGDGADIVLGGENTDHIFGGAGDDILIGDDYQLTSTSWSEFLNNLFNETIGLSVSASPIGAGADQIFGEGDFDILIGGDGIDHLDSGGTGQFLGGIAIGDALEISAGVGISLKDLLKDASSDQDSANKKAKGFWSVAWQMLGLPSVSLAGTGTPGSMVGDTIVGTPGIDLLIGSAGDDAIDSRGGLADVAFGLDGNDTLDAKDALLALLVGDSGNDKLIGPQGNSGLAAVAIGDGFADQGVPNPLSFVPAVNIDFENAQFSKLSWGVGVVAQGKGVDTITSSAALTVAVGGDAKDDISVDGLVNLVLGDSVNAGGSLTIDFAALNQAPTPEEKFDQLKDHFAMPGLTGIGNDVVKAGGFVNLVIGGKGNDQIIGSESGLDILFGNDGLDTITANDGFNFIVGGDAKDILTGGDDSNVVIGDSFRFVPGGIDLKSLREGILDFGVGLMPEGAGDDIITTGAGLFDIIIAGHGDDTIEAGDGVNIVFADTFEIGGALSINLKSQFSLANLLLWAADLTNQAANDVVEDVTALFAFKGNGIDDYTGGSSIDVVFGGDGDDTLRVGGGIDLAVGGAGNDTVTGALFPLDNSGNILFGGPGADILTGGPGNDLLESEGGEDIFRGGPGDDVIFAGDGADQLFGEEGDDQLFGEGGDDLLVGGPGVDLLDGGPGKNVLIQETDSLSVTAVVVNDGEQQRSNIERIGVTFSQGANIQALIDGGQISTAVRLFNGGAVPLTDDRFRYDADIFTLEIDLTIDGFGGSRATMLSDASYELRLDTSLITASGNPNSQLVDDDEILDGVRQIQFHRLEGDFDETRLVDGADRTEFFAHFGSIEGDTRYEFAFDFDDDGLINIIDYAALTRLFGNNL